MRGTFEKRVMAPLGALWLALFALTAGHSFAAEDPKVVVLGFDGADARLVERYMAEGHLPNLAALAAEGSFSPLLPTNPPQTPVSWSAFATGLDPGRTTIFDFLKRDPAYYTPSFALMEEGKRTLLWGVHNRWIPALVAGALAALLALLVTWKLKVGALPRLAIAAFIGVGAGWPAMVAWGDRLPVEVPDATNNRQGTTWWEIAAEAGKRVKVIRVPATFPAEPVSGGRMLSGLGVPDMRGRIGTPFYYTSDPTFGVDDNEFSVEIIKLTARRGTIETRILGPENKPFYDYVVDRRLEDVSPEERARAGRRIRAELDDAGIPRRIDLPLRIDATDATATVELSGQTATLRPGEWSEWFVLDFPVNGLVDRVQPLRGMVRMKLLALEPELALYVSPIGFHPDCHPIAFSWPPDHSEELAERFGLYKTLGWALDTWTPSSGIVDARLFLEDMEFTVGQYEKMMEGMLADEDWDVYVQIFYFTDRIGHLLWRYFDERHPRFDAEEAEFYRGQMLEAYKRMDSIVGKVRGSLAPDTELLVLSDHGFSSFRRGVNYNTWLVENGLMTLKNQDSVERVEVAQLFDDAGDLFANVDWSRTKAYAMGLGSIYVNLAGREGNGIVMPGPEYEAVRNQIIEGLEALTDPETGERPVTKVWKREEMYGDFDPESVPDLRASNALDYRVSWQTTLGGFGSTVVEDNTRTWSGDHCSNDPEQVKGIFFSTRAVDVPDPRMVDVMPSLLELMGVAVPEGLDGRSFY